MENFKNKDVLFYEMALRDVRQKGVDFTATISRNRELAEKEARHLREVLQPDKEMVEYREKLKVIQDQFTKKDAEGNMVSKFVNIDGQRREVPDILGIEDSDSEYAKAYAQLQQEYTEPIKEYERIINEFNGSLEKENKNFKPILIDYEDIPDSITQDEMDIIWNLIDRDTMPDKLK